MSDTKAADLLQFAQEYASKDVDLYELLGIDALTPKEDIHRAWRKRSLKYHPDKAGDNFDAEKWQLFERARDILSEPGARGAYDGAIKAALLRKQERETMDKQRKAFVDDLEARENAWKRSRRRGHDWLNRDACARRRKGAKPLLRKKSKTLRKHADE
jgi:DnaJ family protein C protein 17